MWDKVAEGLRNPDLLTQQYTAWRKGYPQKLEQTSNRLAQVTRDLEHIAKKRDAWLELYTDGEIDRNRLRDEQERLRVRQVGLEQEKRALEAILRQPEDMEANIETFNEFCSTVSDRLDDLTFEEKQKILRLLNIQGRVGDGKIYLSGCVPTWGKDRQKFDYSAFEPD